jgi:hypothetical protein
MSAFV